MSTRSATAPLDVARAEGRPPTLTAPAFDVAPGWLAEHRDALRATVARHGSVLIRGLGLSDRAKVVDAFAQIAPDRVIEREAFAARTSYGQGVYSSSTWPATQPMCMHHELSYLLSVPSLMLFACLVPPTSGGVTGIADAAAVLEALPADLVNRFEDQGWMLVRNYTEEIGAGVADSLGTDDPAAVERYCRDQGIEWEWLEDGGLRTRQRRRAVAVHPVTGRRCWFNQVAFLSEWTMDPDVREFLVDMYGAEGLPFTTRFGNGDPIGEDVVELLNDVYDSVTVREPWRAGDLMLVDNIGTAHSREPYDGPREILVAMAGPVDVGTLAATEGGTAP